MADAVKELGSKVQAALKLFTMEQADQIIGKKPGPGYKELVQGMSAQHTFFWEVMRRHGLKSDKESQSILGKHMTIVLAMLHYAYALGIKQGREGAK